MDKLGAGSFIYAKASGIIGKSFIGPRAELLFEQKSLSELWNLLFKTPVPAVPEVMLAERIESECFNRFIKQYSYFVSLYTKPDSILLDQLRIYESENLKEVGAALCSGETVLPNLVDLGKFSKLNFKNWPDIAAITKGTEYSWYNKIPEIHEQQELEFKLDLQVIRGLWNSIQKISDESREVLIDLYKNEYIIKNIIWALRLRIYYKMEKDEIIKKMIYVTDAPNASDPIAGPVLKILDKPLDEYEQWSSWKYSELINPHIDGVVWQIDPSWIEQMNRVKINKMALHIFHQYPMTTCSLIGWYEIKKYELRCIRTAVESLRLNINPEEAKNAVGIKAVER